MEHFFMCSDTFAGGSDLVHDGSKSWASAESL